MSCSNGSVLDGLARRDYYSLLLFCKELMDLGSLLCWQTIYTPDWPFSMSDLDCGARNGRFTCCHLLQGVDGTWIRFRIDGQSNHHNEDL